MWRRAGGFGATALTIAIATLFACRQLVGITDDPRQDLTSVVAGLPYGTTACASCVNAICSAETAMCAADPVCSAYEGCLGKCNGDPACRSRCTIDNPVGTSSDVSALSACLASKCEAPCNLNCGAVAGYISEPPSAASCQSCIETTPGACTDSRALAASVDGDAYWRCILACPTEDCRLTCGTDHSSGATLFARFNQDYSGICASPCAYGNYWACAGHVNWPVAKSETVRRTDTISGAGPLNVSICVGCPCGTAASPVLAEAGTDDAGVFTLTFPQVLNANGIGDAIGLDGCLQITSPTMSYIPQFGYWGYPISEPVVVNTKDTTAVTTSDQLANSLAMIRLVQDPMRGWVAADVRDCVGSAAPGVRVTTSSSDPRISAFYYQAVGSEIESTNASGQVFFFNVPTGLLTLTASPVGLGRPSSQVTVNVAEGTETGLYMSPTPIP